MRQDGWPGQPSRTTYTPKHRCHSMPNGVAQVAAARKLAVRLYWMLRTHKARPESVAIESSPRVPLVSAS